MNNALSRRGLLNFAALVVAVLALGPLAAKGATSRYGAGNPNTPLEVYPTHYDTQRYTYIEQLPQFNPATPLETNEMRITFMGSTFPMVHRVQAEMSLFVEVGRNPGSTNVALDQFVFDLGCGASANYTSAGIDFARMNKIFLNHLHADHISDLIQVYSFGNGAGRKSPLYVWGSTNSLVQNPGNEPLLGPNYLTQNFSAVPEYYDDGVYHLCFHLREALRWQTESQAFQTSAFATYPMPAEIKELWGLPVLPLPVGDDPPQDANALIPISLEWWRTGVGADGKRTGDNVAYNNQGTGAKITHYPVIHCRQGSMGYKLEWTPPGATKPLTMIYSSDTKPETNSVYEACNFDRAGNPQGVDVFIHEMILAPEALTMRGGGMLEPPTKTNDSPAVVTYWSNAVYSTTQVENSSHTPQGAFGHMLSTITPRPRLTVATHFPTADDTVASALRSIQAHCPDIKKLGDQLVVSFDLMVLRVFPDKILQRRAVVNDFAFATTSSVTYTNLYVPKYHTATGDWDPFVQLDMSAQIPATNSDGTINYRPDGY